MERSILRIFALCLALVTDIKPFLTGAPPTPEVCSTMIPGHGVEPQKSAPPYNLKTEVIMTEGEVVITLEGNTSEEYFSGFLLQVRDKNNKPFGEFKPEIESHLLNCTPGINNAITHSDGHTEKHSMKFTWKCPTIVNGEKYEGVALPIATVVRKKIEFWVNVTDDPLYINEE